MKIEIETANIKLAEDELKLEMGFDEVPEMIHTSVEIPELENNWMLDLKNAVEIDIN